MSRKPTKAELKAAQAKHLAGLFDAADVTPPTTQRADAERTTRAKKLSEAAAAKQRQLSDDEAAKLEALRTQAKPTASPAPVQTDPDTDTPPAPAPRSNLAELSDRNDLADAALRNMRQHARQASRPQPPAPAPMTPPPAPATPPAEPAASDPSPAGARPTRRPAPTPEELDRLLKAMAARSRRAPAPGARPQSAGGPGGESAPDAAPAVETPPDLPEEAPEKNQEKQAEILKGLQAREAAAQQHAPSLPEPDQQRAEAAPVEVKVPIVTEDNAVTAAPLHDALADLAREMGAKNAPGQVDGANRVQREMPGHPLYKGDDRG